METYKKNIRLRKHSGLDKAKVYCAQLVNGHQESAYETAQNDAVFTHLSFISHHQIPFLKGKLNGFSYNSGYAVDCGQSELLLLENNVPIKGLWYSSSGMVSALQ